MADKRLPKSIWMDITGKKEKRNTTYCMVRVSTQQWGTEIWVGIYMEEETGDILSSVTMGTGKMYMYCEARNIYVHITKYHYTYTLYMYYTTNKEIYSCMHKHTHTHTLNWCTDALVTNPHKTQIFENSKIF